MYTGIVQGLEKILDVRQGDGFSTLVVSNTHNFFHDVFIGASVAINGTCLTATHIDLTANQVHFDVSDLTRRLTTLGTLQTGDEVNIERSAKVGMENGGAQLVWTYRRNGYSKAAEPSRRDSACGSSHSRGQY